jgi:alanine-synthesizing transaminase
MQHIKQSKKLNDVCYDIRGPIHQHANRLEEDGHRIFKLNIGNPGAFGFGAPDEIIQDVIHNLLSFKRSLQCKKSCHAALSGYGYTRC